MSFYEDLKRNLKTLLEDNSDIPFPHSGEAVRNRMQFPIGRGAVDMQRVGTVNPNAFFNPLKSAEGEVGMTLAGYNPILDKIKINPQAGAEGGSAATLAHEFRHRDKRWALPTNRNHEKITVLDMLESQNTEELRQARGYNQSFRGDAPPLKGQALLDYMAEQKPWIVEESLKSAKNLGIPVEDYDKLVDQLTRRMLTDPFTQGKFENVTDLAYKRYLQNKSDIQKRRQALDIQYGSTFKDDLTRPGPTRARHDWEKLGIWESN